jgi:hypothetical protein
MNAITRFILTAAFIGSLCFAISSTNDVSWLTVWFLLFIFGGVPLGLLATKDILVAFRPSWMGPSQLLLHICALFAAVIGYAVGWMAVDSGHEKARLHQLAVVIFPLMVYGTPLLMVFNGMPLSRVKEFYFRSSQVEDDD